MTLAAQRGSPPAFVENDGGRTQAGFKGKVGDCVTRSIAIALERPYRQVYDDLASAMAKAGEPRSARDGVTRKVYDKYLADTGAIWTPTMAIGSGCQVHVRADELPKAGRYILRLSGHLTALVDGKIHDTHDPSRGGTRCVYGYWTMPERSFT